MLYSVWNLTRKSWATSTNFSTEREAADLLATIVRKCHDRYEVRPRQFGTIKE